MFNLFSYIMIKIEYFNILLRRVFIVLKNTMSATFTLSKLAEALGVVLPPDVDGKTKLKILPLDGKRVTPFDKAYALHDHLLGRMYGSCHTVHFRNFVDAVGSLKSGLYVKHHRNRQSSWECALCTFANKCGDTQCAMCGCAKDNSDSRSVMSAQTTLHNR